MYNVEQEAQGPRDPPHLPQGMHARVYAFVWQLDLLELSHFQSILLTAWLMSTQAKHHKPSNRNACLIQCTCNSYNTVRECCIHLC